MPCTSRRFDSPIAWPPAWNTPTYPAAATPSTVGRRRSARHTAHWGSPRPILSPQREIIRAALGILYAFFPTLRWFAAYAHSPWEELLAFVSEHIPCGRSRQEVGTCPSIHPGFRSDAAKPSPSHQAESGRRRSHRHAGKHVSARGGRLAKRGQRPHWRVSYIRAPTGRSGLAWAPQRRRLQEQSARAMPRGPRRTIPGICAQWIPSERRLRPCAVLRIAPAAAPRFSRGPDGRSIAPEPEPGAACAPGSESCADTTSRARRPAPGTLRSQHVAPRSPGDSSRLRSRSRRSAKQDTRRACSTTTRRHPASHR